MIYIIAGIKNLKKGWIFMKKIVSAMLLIIMIFTISSCSTEKETSSEKLQTLNIGILQDTDSIPILIAKEQGYFKDENLNVNIEQFKSAQERDSVLQSGKIDGVISDIMAAVFANDGGFDVKITSLTNGTYDLLVNKDESINRLQDLKGKSIAISKNTLIEYVTDMILKNAGLTDKDVNKVSIPQMPTRLEMLQNGKVDAATLPNALATVAMMNGSKMLSNSNDLGINPGVLLFTSSAIDSKKSEIKAFYIAYNKAVDYLNKEPKSAYIDKVIKDGGFPKEIKDTLKLPIYQKASLPNKKDFDDVIKWLTDKGLIKNKYSYGDLVTDEFIK